MTSRLTLAALLLAATAAPAHADTLQRLYHHAEKRAEAAPAPESGTKAGVRKRFGEYEPPTTVMAGDVRSVMHVHRTPDGRLVTECRIEYPGRDPEHGHGIRPPREQR